MSSESSDSISSSILPPTPKDQNINKNPIMTIPISDHTSLLPQNHHPPSSSSKLVFYILFITILILSATISLTFFFYFHSSSSSSTHVPVSTISRPLTKLKNPTILLISLDGFRFGYQYKTPTPNIHKLITNGTSASLGLIPVFPTLTFPNHYSIVTGLYPAHHGIINNHFTDPITNATFSMSSHEPAWWLGEPIWETVSNDGLIASTYFWPGSEVRKGKWDCPVGYCMPYNGSVPFQDRVDTVLSYFELEESRIPSFMTLYFEDPDHQGHQVGPDDPMISEAVGRMDGVIGSLIDGLVERGVFEDVNIILLGDHGMVGTCDQKLIFLDDLVKFVEVPEDWVQSYTPLLAIRPPQGVEVKGVVDKMNEGLGSGSVKNGEYLKVYLKEDLPKRLHYWDSDRIPPIIGLVEEGYKVEQTRLDKQECGGAHGYDNAFFSMRTIFVGHGPRFARGRQVESFENVEIYNVMTEILNIRGAENNGTASFPQSILLPTQ